jgi:hypothetical protein
MGKRGTDIEEFLMNYSYRLRWVNECLCCHHKGCKPEMPEPEVDISAFTPAKPQVSGLWYRESEGYYGCIGESA